MSWIAAPAGLYACFKHQVSDTAPVEFSYQRVYAFDEQGNALIIDQNGNGLAPAKNLRNFHGLSDHDGEHHAIRQIITAPPGLRWTDGNGHFAPIVAYALTEMGQVVAMLPHDDGASIRRLTAARHGHLVDADGQEWSDGPPGSASTPS